MLPDNKYWTVPAKTPILENTISSHNIYKINFCVVKVLHLLIKNSYQTATNEIPVITNKLVLYQHNF